MWWVWSYWWWFSRRYDDDAMYVPLYHTCPVGPRHLYGVFALLILSSLCVLIINETVRRSMLRWDGCTPPEWKRERGRWISCICGQIMPRLNTSEGRGLKWRNPCKKVIHVPESIHETPNWLYIVLSLLSDEKKLPFYVYDGLQCPRKGKEAHYFRVPIPAPI